MSNGKSELVEKNYCPICNKYLEFEPFDSIEYSKCPLCGSLGKHRIAYLLFQGRYGEMLNHPIKLLHIAPERVLYNYFKNQKNIDYYPVGFSNLKLSESSDIELRENVNVKKTPYPDNEFDFIYNDHILQYVEEDTDALKEIYRILKSDGICIIPITINNPIDEISEKKKLNTPEKHHDSYKIIYIMDLVDKFEDCGFNVETLTDEEILDFDFEKSLYNIMPDTKIIVCKKE